MTGSRHILRRGPTRAGRFAISTVWTGAALVAAALVIVFATVLAVVGLAAAGLLFISGGLRRIRPTALADPDLIEARHVGGHNWVAYGFDGRS